MAPPILDCMFSDKTASCIVLLECKFEGVCIFLRDLILVGKIRSAGVRTNTAHRKVNAYVYEIVFFEFEGV